MSGDPHFTNVVFLSGFDGADGATTASDESNSTHALTFNDNAQVDTAISKFGGGSLILDGSNDYVSVPDSDDLDFTGEFTVECWTRHTSTTGTRGIINRANSGEISWRLYQSNGNLTFQISTDKISATHSISAAVFTSGNLNTWMHLAADRDASGTLRLYVNGVMVASKLSATGTTYTAGTLWIGHIPLLGSFVGHIDEIRITKGVARYASNDGFTPPTEAFPRSAPTSIDPNFSSVVFLSGFDGTDGATTAIDNSNSAHSLTFNGNAQIDTAFSKFDGSSLNVDGSGDYVSVPDSVDFHFSNGEFTAEAWVRVGTMAGGYHHILGQWHSADNQRSWQLAVNGSSSSGRLELWISDSGTSGTMVAQSAPFIFGSSWLHWAVDFDGTTYRIYQSGVMVASGTSVLTAFDSTSDFSIGAQPDGTQPFLGHVDELRITKGFARYASDAGFTVPSEAYPRSVPASVDPNFDNVVFLPDFDGADGAVEAIDDSPSAHVITFNGNAQLDTADFKFGTASLLGDGVGDILSVPHNSDFIFSGDFTIEAWVKDSNLGIGERHIIGKYSTSGSNRSWFLYVLNTGRLAAAFSTTGSSATLALSGSSGNVYDAAWHHVCVERSGTTVRLYLDGTVVASGTLSGVLFNNSTIPLQVMRRGGDTTSNDWRGWVDEVRITKGIARYASDAGFIVPATAFPRSSEVVVTSRKRRVQNINVGLWPFTLFGTPVLDGTEDVPYTGFTVTKKGGVDPVTYSLIGTWPAGISIDADTGVVSGTPTEGGSFTGLSVRGTDSTTATTDLNVGTLEIEPASTEPSYGNAGGSGDRTSLITVTSNPTLQGTGDANELVDGLTEDTIWFPSSSSLILTFDFGEGNYKTISEFRWRQSGTGSHGIWVFEASQDGSNWVPLGDNFSLGGATDSTYPQDWDADKGYRYYRLRQLGIGNTVTSPFLHEIDFKLAAAPAAIVDDVNVPTFLNAGGMGDRTALITVTTTATLGGGTTSNMVDGAFASNTTDSMWWSNGQSGRSLTFDFGEGASKIITAFIWYQSSLITHGTWKVQGSNDNSTWVDVSTANTLGSTYYEIFRFDNAIGYRYYRLLQVSGTTSSNPWLREIMFEIADDPTPTYKHHNFVATHSVTTVDVPYPTGLAADDILILMVNYDPVGGTGVVLNIPTGFTRIGNELTPTGGDKTNVLWARADGTETGNLTVTLTGTMAASRIFQVALAAYSGCLASGDPVDDFSEKIASFDDVGGASMDPITTTGPNRRCVCAFMFDDNNARTVGTGGPATGWTQRGEHLSTAGFDGGIALDDTAQAAAGSPENDFFDSTGPANVGVHAFALKPA